MIIFSLFLHVVRGNRDEEGIGEVDVERELLALIIV